MGPQDVMMLLEILRAILEQQTRQADFLRDLVVGQILASDPGADTGGLYNR